MKKPLVIIAFMVFVSAAFAQSAKTIRTYGITTKKEKVEVYFEGEMISSYIQEIERYNKEGDWVLKMVFGPSGQPKLIRERVYDKDELIEESNRDVNGASMKEAQPPSFEKILFEYEKGEVVKETILDDNEQILEVITYEYNSLGDLILISTANSEGAVIEEERIEYDDRGLKIKESRYDENQTLIREKLFLYE